ncbi:MAG: hypothetical protein FWD48_09015 [Oscillospiraceae bacterium]|nr:hypothetical protein [Oscillospiraceae bacterium]
MKEFIRIDKGIHINDSEPVTVKLTGDIVTVKYTDKRNSEFPIERINDDFYIVKSEGTGEVHEVKHGENRLDSTQGVKESLERLRDYINTNVTNHVNCKWLTLTYAENMTDTERLLEDFRAFNRRCRKQYGRYEYITAAEPQQRGAWHLHCLLIFDKPAPYMKNSDVREMWRQGFVNVRKLGEADNLGAYLTAYLGDMSFEDVASAAGKLPNVKASDFKVVETVGADGKKQSKAIIKGARLKLYPKGFHLYRISRGIKKPVEITMCNREAADLVNGYAKIFERSYKIIDNANCFEVMTNKRVYSKNPKARKFMKGSAENGNNADN